MTVYIDFHWWTPERVARLRELWADPAMLTQDIGRVLGCTKHAVIGKAGRLGLAKRHQMWTQIEERYLRDHAGDGARKIGAVLGRTPDAVSNKARSLRVPLNGGTRTPCALSAAPDPASPSEIRAKLARAAIPQPRGSFFRGCTWVEGDPRATWRYCDEPTQERSSFCASHHARCWRPVTRPEQEIVA